MPQLNRFQFGCSLFCLLLLLAKGEIICCRRSRRYLLASEFVAGLSPGFVRAELAFEAY
ncbi:MAG: hypothetical protein WKF84_00025 [Pyrinomonadaceae bacterium]